MEQAKSTIRAILDALPLLPEQRLIQLLSASEHIPHEAYKELRDWAEKELRERGHFGREFVLRIWQNTLDRTQVPKAVAKRRRVPKDTVLEIYALRGARSSRDFLAESSSSREEGDGS